MYKNHRIIAVIPAHNEEKHIGGVIKTLPEFVDHIIVVDDFSQDNTSKAALSSEDPRVLVLKTPHNQGVGGATLLGYQKAMDLGGQIVAKLDGDGQMLAEYLPNLLDAVIDDGYDYAKGNRFLATESLSFMPRHRLLGNVALTFLTKMASGYWNIFDPQNGYTAIKIESLRALDFKKIHKRFFFENDMLVHLNFLDFRVKDIAIPARYGEEESDVNPLKIGFTFPLLLLKSFFRRIYQKYILRDFSPIALFLILGALLFGWGTLFGIYIWIKSAITGRPTLTGTIMLALLPLILGFQLILQAVVLDIQDTPK
jgi:glycosyltransferase involved in cell wall biosynthesis